VALSSRTGRPEEIVLTVVLIARGLPLLPVVRWAVAAASQKVTRPGTSSDFPTSVELAAPARAMALP
jgi:sugar/nucleoside kinase (ribokinase family)